MLRLITPTRFDWFVGSGRDDRALLDAWRDAPLSYAPGDEKGPGWHHDSYAIPLAPASGTAAFGAARDLLLRYRFYPPRIMRTVGDWDVAGRTMQVGDRLIQRFDLAALALGLPPPAGRSPLTLTTMNAISAVVDTPSRAGFSYTTTQRHREQGVWSAAVEASDEGSLTLYVNAISRPAPDEPRRNYRLMRYLQQRAHRLGIAHFRALLAEAAP